MGARGDQDAQLTESEQDALRQHYSDYLGTAEQAGTYQHSQQATQWTGEQEGNRRILDR